jgi:predicted MPP superfamily phosphohydrolase
MTMTSRAVCAIAVFAGVGVFAAGAQTTSLPCQSGSFRFGVIGDFGDGSKGEYATAAKFAELHAACSFDTVITVGDNIYGSERPQEFVKKFETPFKPLLDKGVKFYASLGNHDDPNQRFYKPFNMNEQRYYKLAKRGIDFFALDSNYMDKKQLEWLEGELKGSKADWKVPYFHHPLYSSADGHGSSIDLRNVLEPLFVRYGVQVVFTGHDHTYERTKPQKGIYYFVAGSTGKLRKGDITKSGFTAASYDLGRAVVVGEVTDDAFFFKTVSEQGKVVDSGCIPRTAELPANAGSRTRCPSPAARPAVGENR